MLIGLFLVGNSANSQSKNGRFLSIEIGFQKHSEVDNIVSPFIYKNNITPLTLTIILEKQKFRHFATFETYSSKLNAFTGNTRNVQHHSLKFGYQRKLNPFSLFDIPVQFYGGAEWANVIQINRQHFTNVNSSINASGYFSSAIRMSGVLDFQLHPKHSVIFGLRTPIIQYIVRPGYSLFTPNEDSGDILSNLLDGSFEWFFYGIQLNQHLGYKFKVSRKFYLTSTYRYNIYKIPKTRTFSSIRHGITFGTLIMW